MRSGDNKAEERVDFEELKLSNPGELQREIPDIQLTLHQRGDILDSHSDSDQSSPEGTNPNSPQLTSRSKFLLMQRSHSLQSSLKPAGCRSAAKSVRFADWDGASLTRVRHLSADSVCHRTEHPSTSADSDIRVRLRNLSSNGLFIGGTVDVVNPRYRHQCKEGLYISITTDGWRTFRNIPAFRHEKSTNELFSQWHFSAHLRDLYRWSRCAFKVEYIFNEYVIIDDNQGEYYYLQIETPRRQFHHSRESVISDLLAFDQLLIY